MRRSIILAAAVRFALGALRLLAAALYGHRVKPRDVFSGSVHTAQADSLLHMLPG
jgi:hypothetical protein